MLDSTYVNLKQDVQDGVVRSYWIEDDLLYAKGNRLYVPSGGGLRQELLRETHDPQWASHPRIEQMSTLLSKSYFWPKTSDDVESYVRTCHVCQVDKIDRKAEAGLL